MAEHDESRKQPGSWGKLSGRHRVVATLVFLAVSAGMIAWIGWNWGRASGRRFAIHGPSMAPTLLSDHHVVECAVCELEWPVTTSLDDSPVFCFHCGQQAHVSEKIHAASQVLVKEPMAASEALRSGDVVILAGESLLRVKRIAAVPGDTVELNGAYLMVNGQSVVQRMGPAPQLDLPLPLLTFEWDDRRMQSRWIGQGWNRSDQRIWESSDSDWLVYQHRSIHQQNQPSIVWDDYPYNTDVNRKLQPASRYVFKAEVACEGEVVLEVAFWLKQQTYGVVQTVTGSTEFAVSSDDATALAGSVVDDQCPVAIRVLEGHAHLSKLEVARQIEYRLRPHDDRTFYPIQLGKGEYFVLGDNVPVSVDSRDFGVISSENIMGKVELLQPR